MPVAVVTGGSSGIGAAVARELAARDWQCVLIARNEARLQAVAAEVGGEYKVCDVGDRDAVTRTAAVVRERHPAIKLLVNSAGFARRQGERRPTTFIDSDPNRIEELFRVNFFGAVWSLREFLSALEAGRPSHVVNVGSVAGTVAISPGVYSAAKHALVAFSRALAADPPAEGVLVHTVNPGLVETPGFPQRSRLPRLATRAVVEPEYVARRIVRAVEHGRSEIFTPEWYRAAAIAQAVAPGLVRRTLSRRARHRRSRA